MTSSVFADVHPTGGAGLAATEPITRPSAPCRLRAGRSGQGAVATGCVPVSRQPRLFWFRHV